MLETVSYIDQILIYLVFGLAANLILGYTGVLQAAPAAFGAFGGYAVVYLTSTHHWPWILAVIVGVAMALVAGFLIGLPALYLSSLWVLLLTLAVGLVIDSILTGVQTFGGDNGLQQSSSLDLFGLQLNEPTQVLPLAAVVAVIVLAVCWRIGESPYGRVLRGIRADDSAVYALGKNVYTYKLSMFVVTAGLSGLGGALLATLTNVASPTEFNYTASVEIIAIVIIGGVGNPFGTVIGSAIVVLLVPFFQDVIQVTPQTAANIQLIGYGLVLTLVVLFRPSGALPEGFTISSARSALNRRLSSGRRAQTPPIAEGAAERRRARQAARDLERVGDPAPQGVVLEVRDVSKAFGGIKAVNDLSMELQGGKITALIGANGAGKTTVFNLLTGALSLDAGEVYLNGQNITGLRPDQIANLGMVRTFQDVRLFHGMTVLDNVLMGVPGQAGEHLVPLFFRIGKTRAREREARAIARRWLEFVGLEDFAGVRVEALGYGQQKLVSLARILATDARVLLLDEPASGIDYQFLDEMLDVISQLRDEGRTVCIVEHNLDVVGRLADHVYFMEVGKVTAEGNITDLTSDERLAEVYFGGGS
jgi:branched-chain amino acid transport system permease protein